MTPERSPKAPRPIAPTSLFISSSESSPRKHCERASTWFCPAHQRSEGQAVRVLSVRCSSRTDPASSISALRKSCSRLRDTLLVKALASSVVKTATTGTQKNAASQRDQVTIIKVQREARAVHRRAKGVYAQALEQLSRLLRGPPFRGRLARCTQTRAFTHCIWLLDYILSIRVAGL